MKKLLLISNSTQHGSGFLDHCAGQIKDFLGNDIDRILFIPYAGGDLDAYAAKVRNRCQELGYEVDSLHEADNPVKAIENARAIFTGGGNTFRLLNSLYQLNVLDIIREKVNLGTPYIGTSAGTNVACISIKTTNDMPIIYPPEFAALSLVPFNINPHYLDEHPEYHKGETREERIREFHELNDPPVVGLREGTMLWVENNSIILKGVAGARIFRKNQAPVEYEPESDLSSLLNQ
jgi:dipeptidase E